MNQYFFKVYTNEPKPETIDQRVMQDRHMETIIHEYIHYLHEISTHIGTLSLLYSVTYRSVLSHYVDKALDTSGFDKGITLLHAELLAGIEETMGAMIGDDLSGIKGKIYRIESFDLTGYDIQIPHGEQTVSRHIKIPSLLVQNGHEQVHLDFGKFFLYEGLAYELEKIFQKNARKISDDDMDGTEYTIMRHLARLIAPEASLHAVLSIASISLFYVNCGDMFVYYLQQLVKATGEGTAETEYMQRLKTRLGREYQERFGLLTDVLDEIDQAYRSRSSLHVAFRALRQQYTDSYQARINNPAFEVDMIVAHDITRLLTLVPPCDYWYIFNDKDDYMRDFAGTSRHRLENGLEIAEAHRILIAHIHYADVLFYQVLGEIQEIAPGHEVVQCPFYTSCDLKFRREVPEICNSRPWETYDLSYHSDKKYCDYGSGVLQTKGINTPLS